MVGTIPLHGSTASHPPFACAVAASKRSSCARRRSSRIAARTQTTAIVSDAPKDRVHGGQLSRGQQLARRQADAWGRRSRRRDGWSRQAPRTASLALSGAPNGRHQRSADAHDDSPTQKAQVRSRSHNGSARHHGRRGQDRRQMAAMNAAKFYQGHDRAAASRRLGNDGRRARGDRMRHSEQQACIRRTIRARRNLNFAWRRPVPRVS
jgi:hypothetical protein